MHGVLSPDLSFAKLRANLIEDGWVQIPIARLQPPLVADEPELARFEKGRQVLAYSFNPAVRLRLVEGAVPNWLDVLPEADVAVMLDDDDPEVAVLAILAIAALGLQGLGQEVSAAAARLPTDVAELVSQAVVQLSPQERSTSAEVSTTSEAAAFETLPVGLQRSVLRQVIDSASDEAAGLVTVALRSDDPELAAVAVIGAARLGLRQLRQDVARAKLEVSGVNRHERAVLLALKTLCDETLAGGRPGSGPDPKDRMWRAVLGHPLADDELDATFLFVAALAEPPPPIDDEETEAGYRLVSSVTHFLGHAERGGLPNPIRRWCPPADFYIAESPLAGMVPADGVAKILEAEAGKRGYEVRLPLADEWEAAIRGPSGRRRSWGISQHPVDGSAASVWGVEPGPIGAGEWVRDGDGLVIVGAERSGLASYRIAPEPEALAAVRPVIAESL